MNRRPELERQVKEFMKGVQYEYSVTDEEAKKYQEYFQQGARFMHDKQVERYLRTQEKVQWWKLFAVVFLGCSLSLVGFTWLLTVMK